MSEKLQKVLARAGLGSRRALEQVIADGRVSVNGQVATLGDRVEVSDKVVVDGRPVQLVAEDEARRRVIIYNKPEGEICSRNDPEGRPTCFDRLPRLTGERWVSVGRLDMNTSGLLMFTTDGELANRLMHPSSEVEREYAVRVFGEVTEEHVEAVQTGVLLEDGVAKFETVQEAGGEGINRWFHVVTKEGKYRIVRRLWESQELQVSRLIRVRYGCISLPRGLREGKWLELEADDINDIASLVKLNGKKHTGLYGRAKARAERNNKRAFRGKHIRYK